MDIEYSVEVSRQLENEFRRAELLRPMRFARYEPGRELAYDVISVDGANSGRVHLEIEKFVGGGFAGQVYRVKLLDIESTHGLPEELKVGGVFAMKILIPPTSFSRLFRNALYLIGFQGPFQLQVNPAAARSGAIWQKFIRRGAKIRFGDDKAVVDIYATFVDNQIGSCGELSEWIEGRTWRLEVDEHLDLLKRWEKGIEVDANLLGSPEYRAKREFMSNFVKLMHNMGAYEFARQYEWSTWKSQPNCLKRMNTDQSSSEGLVAVDFRAGLALLPFFPMSPGDFKLIVKGLMRGNLVQFDRGDVEKLELYIEANKDEFADMQDMLKELKITEQVYRNSVPDITHHHVKLLYSKRLWATILDSAITRWKVRNIISDRCEKKLRGSRAMTIAFFIIGIFPLMGDFFIKLWGQDYWRKHYWMILTSRNYLKRAFRAKIVEIAIGWHRAGRIGEERVSKTVNQSWRCLYNLPLSMLPASLHRFMTDLQYAKERLEYITIRPIRLYFDAEMREKWLREMVTEGKNKHLLTKDDEHVILSQLKEPFIQKYLKSLAVHVCTLPVTQVVSVLVAIIYILMHPEMPRGQAYGIGLGIIALFQVVPISPGSLVRGLYVLYLVVRERNFKDYNIAVFLGFFKYIGYLAFPIQMTYRYPALARFMACHWATEAVHIVPVFGESGALLEHSVFCLFYNWPLTIRRRMRKRAQLRATLPSRYWHIILCAIAGLAILGITDFIYIKKWGELPTLKEIWWLALIMPLLCGAVVTLGAGGASIWRRVMWGALCGGSIGVLYTAISRILGFNGLVEASELLTRGVWSVFVFTIISTVGVLLTEVSTEPKTG